MSDRLFACLSCHKVYEDDCPNCPDRGDGRGATVGKIKADLRSCPTAGDVNATATHYGFHVAILERAGGEAKTMAIQIKNLARFMRREIERGKK